MEKTLKDILTIKNLNVENYKFMNFTFDKKN